MLRNSEHIGSTDAWPRLTSVLYMRDLDENLISTDAFETDKIKNADF